MLTCGQVPSYIKIWGSMRPTKFDQAQVNWSLRSGVRAKNEGKFELFAVTRKMNFCILPSLSHKIKEINVHNAVCQICVMVLRIRISQLKILVTLTFSPTTIYVM